MKKITTLLFCLLLLGVNNLIGQCTSALDFAGTTQRVEVNNVSYLNGSTKATFEVWLKMEGPISAVRSMLISKNESFELELHPSSPAGGGIGLRINNAAQQYVAFNTNIGNWQHVAVVYNSGAITFYINGALAGTTAQPASIAGSADALAIGCRTGGGRCLNGVLDEVRIWNVARTLAQIQATMNSELTGAESGLVAYYKMNNGTGSPIASDSAPLNNTGTLTTMNPATDWVANAPGVICACPDADNDGTCDADDGCPNDPNKTTPGICGCGTADTDTDNDGTADCNDGCPNDPNKTDPGNCGCGNSDTGPLTITCPASVPVISTNPSCQGVIGDYTNLAIVSGTGCATSTVTQNPMPGTLVNPGTAAIKLTATDNNSGETANCVFNVTVSGGCGN